MVWILPVFNDLVNTVLKLFFVVQIRGEVVVE
jgi:hypothetical protein